MRLMPHLTKRRNVYYFQRRVPNDLCHIWDTTFIRVSLETSNEREANRLVVPHIAEWDEKFRLAREGKLRLFKDDELERIAIAWGSDFQGMVRTATWLDSNPQLPEGQQIEPLPGEFTKALADEQELDRALSDFLAGCEIDIQPGSPDYERLRWFAFQNHAVMFRPERLLTTIRTPERIVSTSSNDYALSKLLERYLEAKSVSPSTESDWRVSVKRFTDIHGDKSVLEITRGDARAFRVLLVKVPSRMPDKLRKGNVQKAVEWADKNDVARLSPASVNKQLTAVKSVLTWAFRETELSDDRQDFNNPFASVSVRDDRIQEEKRVPLSIDDLNAIFGSDHFAKRTGADRWIPLIMLYSGAGLEEVGQLETADIRQDGEVWYFNMMILDEHGSRTKTLKNTEHRTRTIPVHPRLIELGLLAYHEERCNAGDSRLFPELRRSGTDKLTKEYSKSFGRFLRNKIKITDRRKVLYSLRHNFKLATQRAMIPEDIQEALMGHSTKIVSRSHYGAHIRTVPELLLAAISSAEHAGLDLRHLEPGVGNT